MNTKAFRLLALLVISLIIGACSTRNEEPIAIDEGGNEVTLTFTARIPDYKQTTLRSTEHGDMHILLFDAAGQFIKRVQASYNGGVSNSPGYSEEGTYSVTLPKALNIARTLHFVLGYDWVGFDDFTSIGANPAAVMLPLASTNEIFWGTLYLPNGIHDGALNGTTVDLLRNQAKMEVTSSAGNFVIEGFKLHHTQSKGSVAPFNRTTRTFVEGAITVPASSQLQNADNTTPWSLGAQTLFEHNNKLADGDKATYIIVKGRYDGTECYYKLDIVDADKNRLDIQRNYHYKVDIQEVLKIGATTFEGAVNGQAHNNIFLDASIEAYPILSDGERTLKVERTLVILDHADATAIVQADYYPDKDSSNTDNSKLSVSIDQQEANKAIESATINGTGKITIKAISPMPAEQAEAKIIVKVAGQELARTIRVRVRAPFEFAPVTLNGGVNTTLTAQNQEAILRFTIPNNFPSELLPLPIKIEANHFYPAQSGLQLDPAGGKLTYTYSATQKGVQEIKFRTNQTGITNGTVHLTADYFNPASVTYTITGPTIVTGRITYTDWWGGTNYDVPIPKNDRVTPSRGSLVMEQEGRYAYTLPDNASDGEYVTFRYIGYSYGYSRTYTATLTIAQLKVGGVTINLR